MSGTILPGQGSRHVLAIDLNDFIRRAWHGCVNDHRHEPHLAAPTAIDALARVVRGQQPSHLLFAGEGHGSVRLGLYDKYKANRPPKPEGLLFCESQVESAILQTDARVHRFAGLEADDVLHGVVLALWYESIPVVIAARDKDLLAVVNDERRVVVLAGDQAYNEAAVIDKWKVSPRRMTEMLALAGDDADNVPHVKGWGPSAAKKILDAGMLSVLLGPDGYWYVPERFRKAFLANREMIRLAFELVRLRGDQCSERLGLDELAVEPLRIARELGEGADRLRSSREYATF